MTTDVLDGLLDELLAARELLTCLGEVEGPLYLEIDAALSSMEAERIRDAARLIRASREILYRLQAHA